MNKHMNLFYSYGGAELENNVTRSLVITLHQLSPVNLRVFLNDLIGRNRALGWDTSSTKGGLFAEDPLGFDIQIATLSEDSEEEGDEKLTAENGVILGINWGGNQPLEFKPPEQKKVGSARPDARITDRANDMTVLIESKKSDWLYQDQIDRICRSLFKDGTPTSDVFVQVRWTDISETLQRIGQMTKSRLESFLIKEFCEYLDRLGLVDFLGFGQVDFSESENGAKKLNMFLSRVVAERKDELGLKDYEWNQRLYFDNKSLQENLYFWIDQESFYISIVCGAGKKRRCLEIYQMLRNNPDGFRSYLEGIQNELSFLQGITLYLQTDAKFYLTMFRSDFLYKIGYQDFPRNFDTFVKEYLDQKRNRFDWVSKDEINQVFAKEIKASGVQLDKNGQFPRWEETKYGQYCYFDIVFCIPPAHFINKRKDEAIDQMSLILKVLKPRMEEFQKIVASSQ